MRQVKLVKKVSGLLKQLNQREFLHHFGPKKYTFLQHIVALMIKEIGQFSFRRISYFMDLLGFRTPTYSALCKSRKRIPVILWQRMLLLTAGLSSGKIAIDGSGFSKRNASFHYMKRVGMKVPTHGYNKVSMAFDIETKRIHRIRVRVKPRHDVMDVKFLLKDLYVKELYADRGYDADWIFEICYWREIEPQIKTKEWSKKGFFRKVLSEKFDEGKYNKRGLVECGFSCVKRKYGGNVLAKKCWGIKCELYLKAIIYNLGLSS